MKSKVLAKEPTSGKVSMVFRSEACCCRVSPDVGCVPFALQGTGCSPHLLQNVPPSSSQDSLSWNYLVLLTLVELMGTERDRRPLTSQEVAAQTRAGRDILSPCRCITPGCLSAAKCRFLLHANAVGSLSSVLIQALRSLPWNCEVWN